MNKKNPVFYILAASLLGLLIFAYSNHFNNPFQFDDDHTIVNNTYIRDIHNIPLFFKDATTTSSLPANQSYRPGLTTLNAIDYWIGGQDKPVPFYYHLSIFISYILLGFLLYLFLLKIFNLALEHKWNDYFALFGTGFYMLHTANAETINYIIARGDSFSTLMIILSFVIWQYKPNWRKFQIYILPVIIGFFVKEPTIMILPLLILYIYLFEQQASFRDFFSSLEGRKKFSRAGISTIGLFTITLILLQISSHMTSKTFVPGGDSRYLYMITQPFVIMHYVANFILPMNLSADTDWTLATRIFDDKVLIGTGFLLMLILIIWFTSKKKQLRPIAFGIAWFLLALLPTSSIIPLSEVLNDHRTFFPYIGLVMAVVWSISLLLIRMEKDHKKNKSKIIAITVLSSLIICGHAAGTHQRNHVWSSGETLWYDVTQKCPNDPRGLMNYGNALMYKGKLDEALDHYNRAAAIWPRYSYVYINMGIVKNLMNRSIEAENDFKRAMELNNQNPECYYYYAQFLSLKNRIDEAKNLLTQGLALSPAHENMQILKKQLDTVPINSVSKLDQAIIKASNKPTADNYLDLSLQYYLTGDYLSCIKAANEAIKIDPKNDGAYNNICSAYNMLKEWDKAIEAGQKGLKINSNSQLLKNNLVESLKGKSGLNK